MSLPAQIAAAFQRDPTRPLVTWYDDATGERVELSVATTANWVAKTANLLRDELDVQPGDDVVVALPRHWQTPVVQLATWLAGARLVAVPPGIPVPAGAAAFVAEADLAVPRQSRATAVVALSLRPMAARLRDTPPGVVDYASAVPGHGDVFSPGGSAADPAAVVDAAELTAADLLDAVARCGLTAGQRALVRHEPWTLTGLVAAGLAPLLAGAGVVICGGTGDVPQSRLDAERVTTTLG